MHQKTIRDQVQHSFFNRERTFYDMILKRAKELHVLCKKKIELFLGYINKRKSRYQRTTMKPRATLVTRHTPSEQNYQLGKYCYRLTSPQVPICLALLNLKNGTLQVAQSVLHNVAAGAGGLALIKIL